VVELRIEDGNGLELVGFPLTRRANPHILALTGNGAIASAIAA
jgi:ActR/RegA family two-component response regulator